MEFLAIPVVVFGLVILAYVATIAGKVTRIEQQLARLLPPVELSAAVKLLAADPTRKIAAIRAHRDETGCGLAEAKEAVEAFIRSLPSETSHA